MACEALDSLQETLRRILNQSQHPDINQEIISIHDEAAALQIHLKNIPEKTKELFIKYAANATQEIIHYLFSEDDPLYGRWKKSTVEHLKKLRQASHHFKSTAARYGAYSINSVRQLAGSSTSRSATTRKDVVVGFDEDIEEIKNWLTSWDQPQLQVLSIVGVGGTVAVSCSVIASIYIWKIFNWFWLRPRHLEKLLRQQGFKGNSYKLLVGDYKEIGKFNAEAMSKPLDFTHDIACRATPIFHNVRKNYGDNSIIWYGPRPSITIMDPEIIKEIMNKNYDFQKGIVNSLSGMLIRGVGTYETEKWAKHRKLINPAFHLEKLKHMVPSFYLSCSDVLSKWDDEITAAKEGCCEVDVWPYLTAMTSDVISRTAFGSCYEEGRKIFRLQSEQAKLIIKASRIAYIPGWRFFPTKVNRTIKENAKEIKESLKRIINKRMRAMEAGESNIDDDLLGILLNSNLNEIKQHGNDCGMTMEEVIEECRLFYFAGQETTASLLVWTMILLSKHEEWQARARDEVLQVFGKQKPEYQELNHLKIVNMILHETLRLYSPVVALFRATHKEARFGKLSIPAGVGLMMPVLSLHHDPRIWGDDAGKFNPERFSEGAPNAIRGRMAYFPFGWGPRICIGQNFAMLEAKLAMAMILQHYSFKLSLSYSHAPRMIITLQPQHGAHMILTKL